MIPDKHLELIKKLHAKTIKGDLDWETTANPFLYITAFPSYAITIEEKRRTIKIEPDNIFGGTLHDRKKQIIDVYFYILKISDHEGNVIDVIDEEELNENQSDYKSYLKEIFDGARRKARDVEQAVDALLSSLG